MLKFLYILSVSRKIVTFELVPAYHCYSSVEFTYIYQRPTKAKHEYIDFFNIASIKISSYKSLIKSTSQ